MIVKQTTWGDVWPYGYVRDKSGVDWKILDEKAGWLLMQNREGQQASMERPRDDTPVTALFYEEHEALQMIFQVFPGAQIIATEEGVYP